MGCTNPAGLPPTGASLVVRPALPCVHISSSRKVARPTAGNSELFVRGFCPQVPMCTPHTSPSDSSSGAPLKVPWGCGLHGQEQNVRGTCCLPHQAFVGLPDALPRLKLKDTLSTIGGFRAQSLLRPGPPSLEGRRGRSPSPFSIRVGGAPCRPSA